MTVVELLGFISLRRLLAVGFLNHLSKKREI